MRRFFIALLVSVGAGCAAVPTHDTAVVHLEQSKTFPFVVVDFSSVELRTPALKMYRWAATVPPGKQSIRVLALKGPSGAFGIVPMLGSCSGVVTFDAHAGNEYKIAFFRDDGSGALQVVDVATGFVLDQVPCAGRK